MMRDARRQQARYFAEEARARPVPAMKRRREFAVCFRPSADEHAAADIAAHERAVALMSPAGWLAALLFAARSWPPRKVLPAKAHSALMPPSRFDIITKMPSARHSDDEMPTRQICRLFATLLFTFRISSHRLPCSMLPIRRLRRRRHARQQMFCRRARGGATII